MHSIAERAIRGEGSIRDLVNEFYSTVGPLAESGWEIRASQREMSLRFAEQFDLRSEGVDPTVGVIEAPTGTGKGGAYLVPGFLAALRAEEQYRKTGAAVSVKAHPAKLVVSTANIALQGQLIRKDIPALGRILGVQPRATLMKSRQNYVCLDKIQNRDALMYGMQDPDFRAIVEWTRTDRCDGDRESFQGDASAIWHKVSVTSDECGRQACPHFDGEGGKLCYWRAATKEWPSSHIIVGNHHWVALAKGIRVLAYAVDEAHELENALRSVQGRTLSAGSFVSVARRAARMLDDDPKRLEDAMSDLGTHLMGVVEQRIISELGEDDPRSVKYRSPVPLPPGWVPNEVKQEIIQRFRWLRDLRDRVTDVALAMYENHWDEGEVKTRTRATTDPAIKEKVKESRKGANTANRLAELCRLYVSCAMGRPHPEWPSTQSPWAIWAHREQNGDDWKVVTEFAPADVAPAFGSLMERYRAVLLTSATLPDFDSMRLSLGMGASDTATRDATWPRDLETRTGKYATRVRLKPPSGEEDTPGETQEDGDPVSSTMDTSATLSPVPLFEQRLPSPYDVRSMGVLVVPPGPAPKAAEWRSWAVDQVVEAVEQSNGGALILATSNEMMRRYTEALRSLGRWTVLRQGEQGRTQTIAAFRDQEDSVLVGTRSFFQGLDVQGRSCRLVVIDRIPFASPDDPLENAVGDLLVKRALDLNPDTEGATAWMLRAIPEAQNVLIQGIGRLIRSQSDRGAVVLLDGRILYTTSGWGLLRSRLPPFPLSRQISDIGRVLDGQDLRGVVRAVPARRIERLSF